MSRRFLPALAMLVPLTLPAQAFEPTDLEGVWTSALRNTDRGMLELDLRIIDDAGALTLRATRWGDLGTGTCAYAFGVEGAAIDDPVINPAASIATNCPEALSFDLRRVSVDELTLTIDSSLRATMGGLGETTLFGTLRPLRDHERRGAIPNLDILGIAPAMQRADVEARLEELGFEKVKSAAATYDGDYQSMSEHWSRNPNSDGENTDHISLSYTAVQSNSDSAERLVAISRVNEPQEPLSLAVFEDAITEKYGPAPRFGDRAFFRDGRPVTREGNERCAADIHQDVRFSHATYNRFSSSGGRGSQQFSVNCAAEITVGATSDRNTGTVSSYRIMLFDIDMIWEDFWNRWSAIEGAAIANQLEALSALGTEKPEL